MEHYTKVTIFRLIRIVNFSSAIFDMKWRTWEFQCKDRKCDVNGDQSAKLGNQHLAFRRILYNLCTVKHKENYTLTLKLFFTTFPYEGSHSSDVSPCVDGEDDRVHHSVSVFNNKSKIEGSDSNFNDPARNCSSGIASSSEGIGTGAESLPSEDNASMSSSLSLPSAVSKLFTCFTS